MKCCSQMVEDYNSGGGIGAAGQQLKREGSFLDFLAGLFWSARAQVESLLHSSESHLPLLFGSKVDGVAVGPGSVSISSIVQQTIGRFNRYEGGWWCR